MVKRWLWSLKCDGEDDVMVVVRTKTERQEAKTGDGRERWGEREGVTRQGRGRWNGARIMRGTGRMESRELAEAIEETGEVDGQKERKKKRERSVSCVRWKGDVKEGEEGTVEVARPNSRRL